MDILRVTRAIGGFVAIVVLMVMLLGGFLNSSLSVRPETITILLLIIGTLLGADIMFERLPIIIRIEDADDDASKNGDSNDS